MSFDTSKFLNRMYRRVHGIVWDVTTGQIGVKTNDGVYTYSNGDISVNLIDLSVTLPGFAMVTPLDQVQQGDVVVGSDAIIGFVDEVLEKSIRVKDHKGFTKVYSPPKVQIMGVEGVLVVKNFFSTVGGGAQGVNQMLPMLMMMKGNDAKIEELLPLMLFSQANGSAQQAGGFNPMMLMLMKDGLGGGKIDPMMLMMMSGGLGGQAVAGGMNPMMMMMALMSDNDTSPEKTLPTPVARNVPPPLSSVPSF